MKIPFLDLQAQVDEVATEIRAGIESVFARCAFVGGAEVARFESEYAEFVGARHCVGVGNGTDALELALRAVGVRPGGEVVLPANTFVATAEAVSRIGATPVLVDVDESQLLIDPAAAAGAITRRTQAIVPVDLFGQPAFVERIEPLASMAGIPIVEDAAQAHGARRGGRPVGAWAAIVATSFYPGKNLGAAGDAGAVTTDRPELAAAVRMLAAHGSPSKYVHDVVGCNSRLDTVQAVVLRAKLARLEKWNELRRGAASRYAELLAPLAGHVVAPTPAAANEDVWHLYVVRVRDRDRVAAELVAAGIGVGVHYPTPIHLTGAYRFLGHHRGSFPVAERAAEEMLSLPMYPHLGEGAQQRVVEALARAVGAQPR